jgi:uncharacterized membrane protein YozB (DUF420 family)
MDKICILFYIIHAHRIVYYNYSFGLITYVRAWAQVFDKHKKIAHYFSNLAIYVAVTGVVVYLMISPYYVR